MPDETLPKVVVTGEVYEPEAENQSFPEPPPFDAFRHHFGNLGKPPKHSSE